MPEALASDPRAEVEARLVALRPALHRYAARMVGSALDGEDVVQDAILRAVAALDRAPPLGEADPWLFRIVHNAAIDWRRSRQRQPAARELEESDMVSAPDEAARRIATRAALTAFLLLPAAQRGAVILRDVLGYSASETAAILDTSVAAIKAALHRGRARLREVAEANGEDFDDEAAPVATTDLARLQHYADRFNARDFDAIRAMLAEDVRFDLVARMQGGRASFENYFSRYGAMEQWRLDVGRVDGHPALIVTRGDAPAVPANIVAIRWQGDRIARLRDFHHAPYVLDGAAIEFARRGH